MMDNFFYSNHFFCLLQNGVNWVMGVCYMGKKCKLKLANKRYNSKNVMKIIYVAIRVLLGLPWNVPSKLIKGGVSNT